ncbi:PREDICTED: pentatricopeptide repeat-containing protein At2g13420, mitochondrial-like [Tarenaya hassleriana]|uniref:pentatricopeptide repeat-containing protein At2g13420, mitochondrial-like n=1 Tax=Tarenaya hassleriana TaxID=28532 RepID=UPI00053C48F9|nr:PREDICTED: pentatricopeptide repeat-containing protein At2g13420, mitochondrial-like [Tarenaya hassleriana]
MLKLTSSSFPLRRFASVLRRLSSLSIAANDGGKTKLGLPILEPSNDAELVAQILVSHHNPFHFMESSLQLHGVSLSPHLVDQTLLRLQHNSKIALAFFQYLRSLPSPPTTNPTSFNLVIDILARVRQFDVAWQLIVEMEQQNVKPNSQTFLILVKRLIGAGLTRQAIRAFNDAPCFVDNWVGKEEFCFLLDTLCKYGYVKTAAGVFNERRGEFGVNEKIYTVLIGGWCKIRRIDMAERFLKEMVELGIEPNVVTYNVLLNGICRKASLHPEERFEKTVRNAEKVFVEMRKRGMEPDVTSFSIVLHVYSRAHKPELTLEKLNMMKDKGICPTMETYTSVVKCLCSCGRLEDAEQLLNEMVENGISPSSATYNCFFKEYRGRKDANGALNLYRKMKIGLCKPTTQTYNVLLSTFISLNKMDIVKEIWDDLKASETGPDLDSYTSLVHGLCAKEKWREACGHFVEMIEKGFLPQKLTFETLYKGLIQSDKLRTWRRLKKKLDDESITFGSEFQSYPFEPYRR